MKVLITAGGTAEPIDGVRQITNHSTGATGGVIARAFVDRGHRVVLAHAAHAPLGGIGADCEAFVTFADLEAILRRRLAGERFDAVIHLAAVADYSVAAVEVDGRPLEGHRDGKIASGHDVTIRLSPTPKLLDRLRSWSENESVQIVAFKLTREPKPGDREHHVRALLDRGVCDLVVHNDLTDITDDRHPAEIWTQNGPILRTVTKAELADGLLGLIDTDPADRRRPNRE